MIGYITALLLTRIRPSGDSGAGSSRDVVMAGSGASVAMYDLGTGQLMLEQRILFQATVHGIVRDGNTDDAVFVVFGEKRCKLVRFRGFDHPKLDLRLDLGDLDDLILDARLSMDKQEITLATAQGFVQVWNLNRECQLRVLSEARQVLFCACFSPQNLLASGTVFGNIVIWDPRKGDGKTISRLDGHRGAVFHVQWSEDSKHLCSVADDRKVRLWKNGGTNGFELVFSCFGHSSRIWDCKFWSGGVVTSGEDLDLWIWDWKGKCIETISGHFGRNTWCCEVGRSMTTNRELVISGGGDASVKLYDLQTRLLHVRLCDEVDVPPSNKPDPGRSKTPGHIRSITCFNDGNSVLVCKAEHGLWRVDYDQPQSGDEKWTLLFPGNEYIRTLVCPKQRFGLVNSFTGKIKVFDLSTHQVVADWQPFEKFQVRPLEITYDDQGFIHVFLCQKKGCLIAWYSFSPEFSTKTKEVTFEAPSMESSPNSKENTLISSCVWSNMQALFLGDIHGNLFGFDMREGHQQDRCVLESIHANAKLSCLVSRGHRLFSGGHNGMIMEYIVSICNDTLVVRTACTYRTHPITSVDDIRWSSDGNMIVVGSRRRLFFVWDITQRYELIKVVSGGWKRPKSHFVSNGKTTVCFLQVNSSTRMIRAVNTWKPQFMRYCLGHSFHGRAIWAVRWITDNILVTGCENGALRFLRCSFPRDQIEYIDVENYTQVLQTQADQTAWPKQRLDEEITLPNVGAKLQVILCVDAHPSGIRAIWSQPIRGVNGEFIVVSAGGNQIIRAWKLSMMHGRSSMEIELLDEYKPGFKMDDHVQRVLAVTLGNMRHQECDIFAGNSQGDVEVIKLTWDQTRGAHANASASPSNVREESPERKKLRRFEKLFSYMSVLCGCGTLVRTVYLNKGGGKHKPVLCLDQCELGRDNECLVVYGTTEGKMHWCLYPIVSSGKGEMDLHRMGLNCISAHYRQETKVAIVVTGGDDQAIAIVRLGLLNSQSLVQVESKQILQGMCASALRGIRTDGSHIWACGLNQRLRLWRIDESSEGLELLSERVVNASDVNALDVYKDAVAIAGAGIQVFT